jgi:hypothetical protein
VGHPHPHPGFASGRAQQRDAEVADRGGFEREIVGSGAELRDVSDQVGQRAEQDRRGTGGLAQPLGDQPGPAGNGAQVVHAMLALQPAQRGLDQRLERVLGQVHRDSVGQTVCLRHSDASLSLLHQ